MSFIRTYTYLTETDSTNAFLKQKIYCSGTPVYGVIAAEYQTHGRGRLGRSFFSPAGGTYFSAAYPLKGTEKNIPFLALTAGIAVTRSIKELANADTLIKWPNDIYYNGKKLCGILTELVSSAGGLHAVVGIGINTLMTAEAVPTELKNKITSFALSGLPIPDRNALIKRTVEILDSLIYENDLLNTTSSGITSELEEKSFLNGKKVIYNEKTGICGKIAPDGSISIFFDGTEKSVSSGELLLCDF